MAVEAAVAAETIRIESGWGLGVESGRAKLGDWA